MTVTVGTRLSAFWLAWKYVLILGSILAVSLWTNVRQYRAAIAAPFKLEILSKDQALEDSAALLDLAKRRALVLDDAAQRNTNTLELAGKAYRNAAKLRPLPATCAPGQARMDAVNRAYGAPETP